MTEDVGILRQYAQTRVRGILLGIGVPALAAGLFRGLALDLDSVPVTTCLMRFYRLNSQ